MNFCTKCSSYYANPGTCNCYTETAGLRYAPTEATHLCEPDPNSTGMACKHCGRALWGNSTVTTTPGPVRWESPSGLAGGTITIAANDLGSAGAWRAFKDAVGRVRDNGDPVGGAFPA